MNDNHIIITDILDEIINFSLFFYNDEIVEEEHLDKYIIYLNKKINNNSNNNSEFENDCCIKNIDDIISITDYINRLIISLNLTNVIMITSIIYIERLNINITNYNIHKLLLVSMLISSKYVEDVYFNNRYWSRCGGITISVLNKLEKNYLQKINYKLFIHTIDFMCKYNEIFI